MFRYLETIGRSLSVSILYSISNGNALLCSILHGVNPNTFVYNSGGTKIGMNSLMVGGSGNMMRTALVPDSSLTIKVY
jgi:hypothetical protein